MQHTLCTQKVTSCTPILADRPSQSAFHGTYTFIEIVAVETHTCLKTQAVARSETSELDLLVREDRLGNVHSGVGRNRDFKAVLTSVTTTCDVTQGTLVTHGRNRHHSALSKRERRQVKALGQQRLQHSCRRRTL